MNAEFDRRFETKLLKHVAEQKEALRLAKDWGDFRFRAGYIAGLEAILELRGETAQELYGTSHLVRETVRA